LLETIRLAASVGIELVQVREKSIMARQLFELCLEAVDLVRGGDTKLLVNERFDIAVAAGADGVHLTSTSIPIAQVRANVPSDLLIGASAHSAAEVKTARSEGADFAMLGPVFATPGKDQPIGLGEFGVVSRSVEPFPVIGVGGIDSSNFANVVDSGAKGFASIRYLNDFVRMAR
jgi:thiamine-phosphate pyrophosphorylase